nr:hypothetical protein [Tanacetum cinerariifolium]
GNGIQNQIGNGNLVAVRAEGNAARQNGNQIRCYNCKGIRIQLQAEEYDLMAAAADLDEIEEVNANCILMANLQQASSSGTQTDSALVYDFDGSDEVHEYENCYNNDIFNMFTQKEQYTELLEPIPESHQVPKNDNEVISENLAVEVEKVNPVNRKLKETNADLTTELVRYKNQERCFEISQEKYDKLERCYQQSVYQEQCLSKKINALHLSSGKQIMTLNEQISDLNKQLSKEKSTISFLLEEKKKLKSDFKTCEDELLDKCKNPNLRFPGQFYNYQQLHRCLPEDREGWISLDKVSRDAKKVTNTVSASARAKPITVSRPSIINKKEVNSDLNGLSSIGVDNTTKTRRTQLKRSSKNNKVPYVVKSSYKKNKVADVEENHRNLLSSSNKKHVSSACNNFILDSQNVYSKVVCAMCKQCLISVNHDDCLLKYVKDKDSHGTKQKANVSIRETQKN